MKCAQEVYTGTMEDLLNNDELMVKLSGADRDIPAFNRLSREELLQTIAKASETIRECQTEIENATRRLMDTGCKVIPLRAL
ncbi:hypothetical protein [Pelotalea chapellei]|uniref:Uncharacterized protein n=1 Tax=Pelotalea chapellei TaxID=44671 RepID=A0ABS5U5Q8_9BACT|nr:hypothetical protein [Pelotalea chapellei]MBT1070988.1 hypothetical protein [Pelotalea chapellei]